VDLVLTEEQAALKREMRSMFGRLSDWSVVRRAEPLGFDADLWTAVSAAGLAGLCVEPQGEPQGEPPVEAPEDSVTLLEAGLVLEEAGYCAAPVQLAEHLAAARLAVRADALSPDDVAAVCRGELRATLALRPARDGIWSLVPGGAIAHLVLGVSDDGLVLDRDQPSMVARANLACSPLADRAVGKAAAVGDPEMFAAAADEWRALTAALLVGVAARALDLAVDYVKTREQFGRPIGGFQAVQHGLADLVAPLEGARLLALRAAWACDRLPEQRARLASYAFVAASDVARQATAASLHYHGGYGVTNEYDIQLLYRRARGWPLVLDDPEREVSRLADQLFGPPAGSARRDGAMA
jgi:Acyl-CoA dehydrogenase, C-terminal domain